MKRGIICLMFTAVSCIGVAGFLSQVQASYSADREYLDALGWMHATNMTKYKTSDEYNPGGVLLREQAAKFFVAYAETLDLTSVSSSENSCIFTDMATADHTLKSYIIEACELGIIKGSQGKFSPKEVMTKAQALTVLVRIKAGLQNESGTPWRSENFKKAQDSQLTKEKDVWSVDVPVSRYEMALLLGRSAGRTQFSTLDPELEEAYRLMGMMTKYLRTN